MLNITSCIPWLHKHISGDRRHFLHTYHQTLSPLRKYVLTYFFRFFNRNQSFYAHQFILVTFHLACSKVTSVWLGYDFLIQHTGKQHSVAVHSNEAPSNIIKFEFLNGSLLSWLILGNRVLLNLLKKQCILFCSFLFNLLKS